MFQSTGMQRKVSIHHQRLKDQVSLGKNFFASSTSGVSGGKMDGCCFLNFASWYKDTFKDVSIRVSWCHMSLFLINDQWSPPVSWLIYPCPSDFSCFHFLHFFHASGFGEEKKTFFYFIMDIPLSVSEKCPHEIAVWLDWIILTDRSKSFHFFDFHSRAQCQKWWQNCLRTFPWKLKFSVNLSHIQSSGNFQMKSKSNDGHCYEIRQIQFKENPNTPSPPICGESGRVDCSHQFTIWWEVYISPPIHFNSSAWADYT